jgi:uncharacterized protein
MKALQIERNIGFGLLFVVLLLGITGVYASNLVFAKTMIGIGLGYALMRGSFGFAGMSNRACRTGSTSLLRMMMLTVFFGSLLIGAFLITQKFPISLWVRPLSLGLVFGGTMFGIGAAFSSCCATGTLCDLPGSFTKAFITLIFFGLGVLIGKPYMTSEFATQSLFTTGEVNGVFLPDLFKSDGANGVVGAIIVTGLLAVGVYYLALKIEQKNLGKVAPVIIKEEIALSDRLFKQQWRPLTAAFVITGLFGLLYITSGAGWGASTTHGQWVGSILVGLGMSAETVGYVLPEGGIFADAASMQNIGIILGATLSFLLAGGLTQAFKQGLKIKPVEAVLFMIGGLLMGFGSRIALGCNVGAFFTPATNFSLSGWFFLAFLLLGGFFGNRVYKWFYKNIVK